MNWALKVSQLTAKSGSFRLGPLDLEIEQGMALGFIGPNGAGKSTAIHCILGLQRRLSGSVEVFNRAAHPTDSDWRQDVGFVLSNQAFYENLSIEENLKFFSSFYRNWDQGYSRNILKRMNLDTRKKPKVLSVGERAQLCLVMALSHRPKLMIMDEPTSGLDPIVRGVVIEAINDLLRSGEHSLLMSTHILSDITSIADRLTFIKDGKTLQSNAKDDLLDQWRRISFRADRRTNDLPGVVKYESDGAIHLVTTSQAAETVQVLKQRHVEVLESQRIGLEDVAVHILQGTRL